MRSIALAVLISLLLPLGVQAGSSEPLRVAVRMGEPGAFYDAQGRLVGAVVELWELVADTAGVPYTVAVTAYDGPEPVLNAAAAGEVDVALGALSVTAEREERVDFLHPFWTSGLAIATPMQTRAWYHGLVELVSEHVVAIVAFVLSLLGASLFTGRLEDWSPHESFYWAVTTMATVGYGDFAPKTRAGRLVAVVWMFTGIGVFGFVIAQATAVLTATELKPAEMRVSDLHARRVGTVAGSTGADFLVSRKITPEYYGSTSALIDALQAHQVDAAVYDETLLRYWIEKSAYPLRIATTGLSHESYSFAVPQGFKQRERLNHALLRVLQSERWDAIARRYKLTGDDP